MDESQPALASETPAIPQISAPRTYNFLWYASGGFLAGLLCDAMATIYPMVAVFQPITLSSLLLSQATYPLLWFFDAVPFIFAILLGLAGWQVDRQKRALFLAQAEAGRTQQDLEARIAELEKARLEIEQAALEKSGAVRQLQSELANLETESQQTEKAISRAKRQWEASFDSIQDLILLTNSNGTIIRCNRATSAALGGDYRAIIGKQIADFVKGEPGLRQGQIYEVRLPGLERWYEVSSSPLDIGGDWPGSVLILRDVSERKQALRSLQIQKGYYETLLECLPLALATLKLDHSLVECNLAFERLFGFPAAEAIGQDLDALLAPEDQAAQGRALLERLVDGQSVEATLQRRRKDGTLIDVEFFGVRLENRGRPIGLLALFYPQGEQKLLGPSDRQIQKLEVMPGIEPEQAEKLARAGVLTADDLLKSGATRLGRAALSNRTGLPAETILAWVQRADLLRLPGLSYKDVRLLEQAKVDKLETLAQSDPQKLRASLAKLELPDVHYADLPSMETLDGWIAAAQAAAPLVAL